MTESESEWISVVIVENFNDPKKRANVFKEIGKLSRVHWIRPIVISFVDDYIAEQKEWLDELVHFRTAIAIAQKNTKLSQFR